MTTSESGTQADDLLRKHYAQTVANFSAINSENLHFMGYFETADDSLVVALQQLNRHFLRKLALKPEERLLDVGCGTGGPACYLAQASGCRVVGIDIGEVQIDVARKLAETRGLADRVVFQVENAMRLSFKEHQFDAAVLMGSASHIPDKNAAIAECARVLRPGGRLVLGDMVIANPEWFQSRANSAKVKIINLFFANPIVGTRDEYARLIQSNGFEIQEVETLSTHLVRSCHLWQQNFDEQKERLIERLGNGNFRAILASVRSILQAVEAGAFDGLVITAIRTA